MIAEGYRNKEIAELFVPQRENRGKTSVQSHEKTRPAQHILSHSFRHGKGVGDAAHDRSQRGAGAGKPKNDAEQE